MSNGISGLFSYLPQGDTPKPTTRPKSDEAKTNNTSDISDGTFPFSDPSFRIKAELKITPTNTPGKKDITFTITPTERNAVDAFFRHSLDRGDYFAEFTCLLTYNNGKLEFVKASRGSLVKASNGAGSADIYSKTESLSDMDNEAKTYIISFLNKLLEKSSKEVIQNKTILTRIRDEIARTIKAS